MSKKLLYKLLAVLMLAGSRTLGLWCSCRN